MNFRSLDIGAFLRPVSSALHLFFVGFTIICLSGCIFAPGMDMDKSGWRLHGPSVASVDGFSSPIEIQTITEELVRVQNSSQQATLPADLSHDNLSIVADYQIGRDDVLSIVVWGQPELVAAGGSDRSPLTARQVRDDGTIFFPYAGSVKVAGLTREQARQKLIAALGKFFKEPQVDVAIAEYNSRRVVVTGQFNQPLTLPITAAGLTLGEAIALANGPTELADTGALALRRANGKEYVLNYANLTRASGALSRVTLSHGDIVHLPLTQSNKIYVVGDVGRAQTLDVNGGSLTLTDALGAAEGVSPLSGSGNEVFVLRAVGAESSSAEIYRLNAKSPSAYILASRFTLIPQDVVFVGPAELTKWNRVLSQIFPFANLLRVADDISND